MLPELIQLPEISDLPMPDVDLRAELSASVESVLGDVLGARVSLAPSAKKAVALSCAVHILGAFSGVLILDVTESFSTEIAAVLLEAPIEEVTDEDCADALAELGNILGGHIKGMFEGGGMLSRPTFCRGARIEVSGGTPDARCVFANAQGGTLHVSLYRNTATDRLPDAD